MKKLILFVLICSAQNIFSQKIFPAKETHEALTIDTSQASTSEENTIYNTAGLDEKPEFPGGVQEFNKFIEKNFKIPKDGLKGKIYTTFIIEKDGSLSGIKILRDIGYETGSEAIRVLQLSPKWKPGKQNNKLVRVLYSAPLYINIPSN
ncbi:energy transducer TonB [Flavobacterium daemonense]|uniref:energy transducer TonB n=1 Tax=Flavobacterium daemonense TaxID=1393049 RepID=UPI0011858A5F|nr:energy transducer TonB [Flavobacterium daemonense]KAF2332443.1 hypothetical protein FND99_11660 [Flavobacterium daemonense]